jgi:hypothetical protein
MILDSMDVNGHEVAWMQFASFSGNTREDDEEGLGSPETYLGHGLYCACDFLEGVGWHLDEANSMAFMHDETDNCPCKRIALNRRHAELCNEYLDRGILRPKGPVVSEDIETVIFDLMQKSLDHEFIELDNGAHFWGGYFYLQTIESITGIPLEIILETADRMVEEKKITLSGTVVKSFNADKITRDYITVDKDDWYILAALNEEGLSWDVSLVDPDGEDVEIAIDDAMEFLPPFAVGPGDIDRIKGQLEEILDEMRRRRLN